MPDQTGPKRKLKLVTYIRVSTKGQEESGLGLEAQTAMIERYRSGLGDSSILAEYREIESGKVNERPVLARALAHAKRSKARLVIAKLDRLARNVHFISGLMETGVDFVAADSPNDDRFMLHLKASFAEEERRKISQRTREALARLKARGVKLGSARDGARRLAGGSNPEAARKGGQASRENADAAYEEELVDLVKQLRAEGATLEAIAGRLNADGHRTRRGRPWNRVQVLRTLRRFRAGAPGRGGGLPDP